MAIRVLVVNDQPVLRRGLASLLEASATIEIEVVGEAGTCAQCCTLIDEDSPDVVLCELELPDSCCLETLRTLNGQRNKPPLVVFTAHDDRYHLSEALSAGVRGILSRHAAIEALREAIDVVAAGGSYMDPVIAERVIEMARVQSDGVPEKQSGLTDRQLEMLRRVADGLSNREIARALGITVNTVKFHMHRILRRLDVTSRETAVAEAAERGLLLRRPGDHAARERPAPLPRSAR